MMIIHAPQPWTDFHTGDHFLRAIWKRGVRWKKPTKQESSVQSVFQILKKLTLTIFLRHGKVKPVVNQILCHIGNTPFELIDYCRKKGILVEAYSPVAHGEMLKNKDIADMANRYGVSVPQLCIRYCLQLGTLPLPKTVNPAHMADNVQMDFEISNEDMETLKNAEKIKNY